jgi:hypothetical protein
MPIPLTPCKLAPIADATPLSASGFVICAADSDALSILYADDRVQSCFPERDVIGNDFASLFTGPDVAGELREACEALLAGRRVATELAPRSGVVPPRPVTVHMQPMAWSGSAPRHVFCSFDPAPNEHEAGLVAPRRAVAATPREALDDAELDLGEFAEALADRLTWLLPGAVTVDVTVPPWPVWVAAANDPLEEAVALVLAQAAPPNPWRYTVRLSVGIEADGSPSLQLEIDGTKLAETRLPEEVTTRLRELQTSLGATDDGAVTLILPPGDSAPLAIVAAARPSLAA